MKAIAEDPAKAFDYTTRGNMVAVISNGTAILGLGNLGALASKPVMEGKAVLFKRFADVDSIDLEVDTENVDEFVNCVRYLGPSFGGINLEDIKAPDCFIIEQRLRELMDIPVFHDDQHGTAIISAAGLINALEITGRDMKSAKLVCNGAGSAGIACIELIKSMGFSPDNIILCDTKGVVYQGRTEGMNQWKSAHAVKTDARTLAEALDGADIVFGLSAKGAFTDAMIRSMAPNPIIFAMANPDPEITPGGGRENPLRRHHGDRPLGLSQPGQQRSRLPLYLPRRARCPRHHHQRRHEGRRGRSARSTCPPGRARRRRRRLPGQPPEIRPAIHHPGALRPPPHLGDPARRGARRDGVRASPASRSPTSRNTRRSSRPAATRSPRRSAASTTACAASPSASSSPRARRSRSCAPPSPMSARSLGTAVLVGREEIVRENAKLAGVDLAKPGIQIINARLSKRNTVYADFLYERLQRKGYLFRDAQRLINNDRNHFAACMVALGDADAMVTGLTRNYSTALDDIRRVIDAKPGHRVIGVSIALCRGRTVIVADTAVHDMPNAEQIADIAEEAAGFARRMGYEPRVAMLAYSTFGHPAGERSERVQEAVKILDKRRVDFEYDGEMAADVALNPEAMKRYPFIRLSGPANVLVMPAFHSA